MTPERWTDERIGDLSARLADLSSQMLAVAGLTAQVGVHSAQIEQLKDADDALRESAREAVRDLKRTLETFDSECEKKVDRIDRLVADLQGKIEQQDKARVAVDRDQARERKMDRRWLIGTMLAATTVIVSAMALLVDKL